MNEKDLLEKEELKDNLNEEEVQEEQATEEEVQEKANEEEPQEELTEEKKLSHEIFDIDVKAQELEVVLDQLEAKLYRDLDNEELEEEFFEKKREYNALLKKKRKLIKQLRSKDESKLSQVSAWIIIYGSLVAIFSFPLISSTVWLEFANILINALTGAFNGLSTDNFLYYIIIFLLIFSLPLLINVVTWLLYNNFVKTKLDKKVYIIFWIIQAVMSLYMIVYMSIQLYG